VGSSLPTLPESDQSRDPGRQLVYLAAERTLLTWIRTAATMMVLGFAVDRFGLFLMIRAAGDAGMVPSNTGRLSAWFGLASIAIGVLATTASAIRFAFFARRYALGDSRPGPGLMLSLALSGLVALGGMVLGAYLWIVSPP
jgi:putative membrane protein